MITVKQYMTNNDCYKAGKPMVPKGIMVHSTGAPGVMAAAWFGRWNKPGVLKCVHAFVDDTGVWQYLPWNHRGWHAGGKANDTHIGFEICEDKGWNKDYFDAAWGNAVALTVYLCRMYGLTEKNVISHKEGRQQGIASNHGDPDHWWSKFGRTMDDFRRDVAQILTGDAPSSDGDHPTMGAKQVNTPGDTLNVRNTANASGAILGTLAHGSVVDVVGLAGNGWVLVRQGGLKGWVNGKYLSPVKDEFVPYVVRVTADVLNIRKGPGVEHAVAGQIKDKGSFTIVEEKDGWGRLKSGAGWISLKYTEKR